MQIWSQSWSWLKKNWSWLVAMGVLIISIAQTTKVLGIEGQGQDFEVYYQTAKVWREGGDIYGDLGLGEGMTYLYPAVGLILFYPLSFLELKVAKVVWLVGNYLASGGVVYLILWLKAWQKKATEENGGKEKASVVKVNGSQWAIILACCLQTFSWKFNLGMGQANIFTLLFLFLGIGATTRKWNLTAGLSLAMAVGLKVWPIFLLPYWLIKRQWRVIGYFIFWFLLLHLPFGEVAFSYYPDILPSIFIVSQRLKMGIEASIYNQAVKGEIGSWGRGVMLIIYVLILGKEWWQEWIGKKRVENEWRSRFKVETILILIGVVIGARMPIWTHYVVYLYPLVIWLGLGMRKRGWLFLVLCWLSLQVKVGEGGGWQQEWLKAYYGWWTWGVVGLSVVLSLIKEKKLLKLAQAEPEVEQK